VEIVHLRERIGADHTKPLQAMASGSYALTTPGMLSFIARAYGRMGIKLGVSP
jgi:hypothetical protein